MDQLPKVFKDATKRQIDDFCPVVQVNANILALGEPDIRTYKDADGKLCATDRNNTWQKIMESLPRFVQKFTGSEQSSSRDDIYSPAEKMVQKTDKVKY